MAGKWIKWLVEGRINWGAVVCCQMACCLTVVHCIANCEHLHFLRWFVLPTSALARVRRTFDRILRSAVRESLYSCAPHLQKPNNTSQCTYTRNGSSIWNAVYFSLYLSLCNFYSVCRHSRLKYPHSFISFCYHVPRYEYYLTYLSDSFCILSWTNLWSFIGKGHLSNYKSSNSNKNFAQLFFFFNFAEE